MNLIHQGRSAWASASSAPVTITCPLCDLHSAGPGLLPGWMSALTSWTHVQNHEPTPQFRVAAGKGSIRPPAAPRRTRYIGLIRS